ncbi:MAG: hypothetical protein ABJA82_16215, partial [Myxococcales bacterium]
MRGKWLAFWLAVGVTCLALVPRAPAGSGRGTATAATAPTAADPASDDNDDSSAPSTQADPAAAQPTTFEALLRGAVTTGDLGALLAPWAGKCDGEKRELDRVRCRATGEYLRKIIPRQSYWVVVDDPTVISVSEYDASIKGYHLAVAGCLACTRPVVVGGAREKRLLTLKTPAREAESLQAAVELSRNSVGFDSLAEAKGWMEQSRPELRTQFVFKPGHTDWTFGSNRGYAMALLGFRVFNRCTGEVLISRPPSSGTADIVAMEEGCRKRDGTGITSHRQPNARVDDVKLPPQLGKNEIETAMNAIRPQVFACFEKFKVPGLAQFAFVVAGNGTINSVRLSGAF